MMRDATCQGSIHCLILFGCQWFIAKSCLLSDCISEPIYHIVCLFHFRWFLVLDYLQIDFLCQLFIHLVLTLLPPFNDFVSYIYSKINSELGSYLSKTLKLHALFLFIHHYGIPLVLEVHILSPPVVLEDLVDLHHPVKALNMSVTECTHQCTY